MGRTFMAVLAAGMLSAQTPPSNALATGTVSGVVRDRGTGTPLADADLFATNGAARAVETTTDSQGRYTLRGLNPGTVRITARRLERGVAPSSTRVVTLAPQQELTSIDFLIRGNAEISGKVIDQNKEPIPGISVMLVAREYNLGAMRYVFANVTRTDDQGQYSLKNIATGRAYLLLTQKRDQRIAALSDSPVRIELRRPAFVPTYYPGTPSVEGAQTFTLKPDELRENVDLQVQRSPSYCVEGVIGAGSSQAMRFSIEPGQPTSGANGNSSLYLGSPGGLTGPDGKIRICDLHPGEHRITVQSETTPTSPAPAFFGIGTITIADKDENRISITAQPKVPVPGEVVWQGIAPEPPVSSMLSLSVRPMIRPPFRDELSGVRSSIPGRFSFEGLFVDDFSVVVTGVPPGSYLKDITYGDRSVLYQPFRPGSATGEATLKVILARDGGTISVKAESKDGKPAADASIAILPANAASEGLLAAAMVVGQTDQNGAWNSTQLAPGKYYPIASQLPIDRSPETISKLWRGRSKAKEVDLGPGGSSRITVAVLASLD